MMSKPKIDKPPYTPTTPVVDPMLQGKFGRQLFAVSTAPVGAPVSAPTRKKVLIGGSA